MKRDVVIVLPKLTAIGGVSAFWNNLLPHLFNVTNLTIKTVEIGGHGKNIFGPLQDQLKLKKALKSKADLAILNPSLGYRSFFRDGFFAKQLVKQNIPFLVFFHGWDLHFEKKIDQRHNAFFRSSFGKAAKIIVLSQEFKNKILQWGYTGEIVVETTNVDSQLLEGFDFESKPPVSASKKINILFMSRLVKEKGVFETLASYRELLKKYPGLELTIAGNGEAFEEVEKCVANQGNIVLTGHVSGNQKIKLLQEAQIYCLPSYSEGLPTSVLEAMAFGIPVVTAKVGGLRDFFQEGKMGLFCEPGSTDSLTTTLDQMLTDEKRMAQMAAFNYNFAKDTLMSDIAAKRLLRHIDVILQARFHELKENYQIN